MKRKMFLAFLMATVVAVMNVYADDDDEHRGYVSVAVEEITAFENIISNASFDVEFTQGNTTSVSIYGAPGQADNVALTVVGKTLYVGTKENTTARNVKVIITAPDLLCAIVNGSGDIDVKNLHNSKLTATVIGSGDIELTGRCDEAEFTVNGSGDIDAEDFPVEMLNVTVNGSGSVDCRCTDTLTAAVVGSGEIEYKGHPRNIYRSGRKAAIRHD